MSPHLISVRLNEARDPKRPELEVKKVAYLIDLQTIRVLDLATGITEATISHEAKVDWMEMNGTGTRPGRSGRRNTAHAAASHRPSSPDEQTPDASPDASPASSGSASPVRVNSTAAMGAVRSLRGLLRRAVATG